MIHSELKNERLPPKRVRLALLAHNEAEGREDPAVSRNVEIRREYTRKCADMRNQSKAANSRVWVKNHLGGHDLTDISKLTSAQLKDALNQNNE